MMQTLWLASWYPSKVSAHNGDFVQRHAQAVSRFSTVYVLYVTPLKNLSKRSETIISANQNLTEEIVYYKKENHILKNVFSVLKYFKFYKKHIKKYFETRGKPHVVHVHVSMRAGILALWIKRKYKIPYLVTEHWTLFTKEDPNNFYKQNFVFRYYAKKIFKNASAILPVSDALGKSISEMVTPITFTTVPNVVNDSFFYNDNKNANQVFTFIHVSSLGKLKNPEGILRAYKTLLNSTENVLLKIVGGNNSSLKKYAKTLNIPSNKIIFTGEFSNDEVAEEMRNANAFILFSTAETFGCVVAESLCSGNPVIIPNLPYVVESVNENNAIIVPLNDEQSLTNAMKSMVESYSTYNRKEISSQAGAQYNYEKVGKKIVDIYNSVLKNEF